MTKDKKLALLRTNLISGYNFYSQKEPKLVLKGKNIQLEFANFLDALLKKFFPRSKRSEYE